MIYVLAKILLYNGILFNFSIFAQNMQIKYVTEFSWDAKVIGEVIIENEEYIAQGFYKMNSKMYPKSWLLRRMFNENDGEIMIRGEKNILKYNSKDKEYWLINIDEYFNKGKKDTVSQSPISRSLFFSIIFENLIDSTIDEFIIKREKGSQLENINGFRAKKWTTTIQSSKQKLLFEEWLVKELSLKDTLDSLKLDIMGSFNSNKDRSRISNMFSSEDFIRSADSTAVVDSLEGRIVQAKMQIEHEFFKSMSFEIKELYTVSFNASSFTIPEAYKRIEKNE
tara:strand:+ start:245 stop:1087 length:843 start_codon:yes stop_codon:yes gene_type:complete